MKSDNIKTKNNNSNKNDLISVIVPCYNSEKTLQRTIDSIIAQTYTNWQLIIINDGSVDGSAKIIDSYTDKRILKITQQNSGISATRNNGIQKAEGKYIAFVDSDDEVSPDFLENLYSAITSGNFQLAMCGVAKIIDGEQIDQTYAKTAFSLPNDLFELYNNEQFGYVCNKLYIKSLIKEFFNTNLTFAEDEIFNWQYLKNVSSVAYVNKSLYKYYITNSGLSKSSHANFVERNLVLYELKNQIITEAFGGNISKQIAAQKLIKSIIVELGYDIVNGKKYKELKPKISSFCNNETIKQVISGTKMFGFKDKLCKFFVKHKFNCLIYFMAKIYSRKK